MSARRPFIHPFRILVALVVMLTPLALAIDVLIISDAAVYEARSQATSLMLADVALAFNGSAIEVQALGSDARLPAIGPRFSANTQRLDPGVVTERAEVARRGPQIQAVVGGVVIEHLTTVEAQVRNAYIAALGELGFVLHVDSHPSTLLFANGTTSVRMRVVSSGETVAAYLGR